MAQAHILDMFYLNIKKQVISMYYKIFEMIEKY